MPGPPTPRATRGGSSTETARLLPTPRTTDGHGAGAHGQGGPDLRTAVSLLPTPRATGGTKGGPGQRGSSGDLMLPSAVVADVMGGRKHRSGERDGELLLNGIAHHDRWGDYAAAIASHERLTGRPAPEPTEPGPKGNPRLSARFVEWMMCLPDGWVTDVPGLTRNEALKALGNGVAVPQAVHALRVMLARMEAAA